MLTYIGDMFHPDNKPRRTSGLFTGVHGTKIPLLDEQGLQGF